MGIYLGGGSSGSLEERRGSEANILQSSSLYDL